MYLQPVSFEPDTQHLLPGRVSEILCLSLRKRTTPYSNIVQSSKTGQLLETVTGMTDGTVSGLSWGGDRVQVGSRGTKNVASCAPHYYDVIENKRKITFEQSSPLAHKRKNNGVTNLRKRKKDVTNYQGPGRWNTQITMASHTPSKATKRDDVSAKLSSPVHIFSRHCHTELSY